MRGRPKFKTGDIIKEFIYYHKGIIEEDIFLVLDCKYKSGKVLKPYGKSRGRKHGKPSRIIKYDWMYTLQNLKDGDIFNIYCKYYDFQTVCLAA